MKIALTVGHSEKVRGMRGSPVPPECDEVNECFKICTDVSQLLQAQGVECPMFFDTTSTSQSAYLQNINNWVNAQPNTDLAVSMHLNAGGGDGPVGCEVWYYSQKTMAAKIATAMAEALDLPDRGPKYSSSLSFLLNTNPPAVLIECFFGDSRTDCGQYAQRYAALVEAIAESMAGIEIDDSPPEPVEPPETETPPSDDNKVIIDSMITGDVTLNVNGKRIVGHDGCEHVVDLQIRGEGDVVLIWDGEAFYNKPAEQPPAAPETMHTDIFATTFGGQADNEYSCYPPFDSSGRGPYLDDTTYYVAIPAKIPEQPRIKVWNRATGRSEVGRLMDVGPWCTTDPYWKGEHGPRPQAEISYMNRTPLPDWTGTHAGEVAGNPAGIDLSPALFKALGMTDNGPVDWCFEEDAPVS